MIVRILNQNLLHLYCHICREGNGMSEAKEATWAGVGEEPLLSLGQGSEPPCPAVHPPTWGSPATVAALGSQLSWAANRWAHERAAHTHSSAVPRPCPALPHNTPADPHPRQEQQCPTAWEEVGWAVWVGGCQSSTFVWIFTSQLGCWDSLQNPGLSWPKWDVQSPYLQT